MKRISELAVNAFLKGQEFYRDNTKVIVTDKEVQLTLFGNCIAKRNAEGTFISDAGWRTNTTKERLNCLLYALNAGRLYQVKGRWYLDDEPWYDGWYKVKP